MPCSVFFYLLHEQSFSSDLALNINLQVILAASGGVSDLILGQPHCAVQFCLLDSCKAAPGALCTGLCLVQQTVPNSGFSGCCCGRSGFYGGLDLDDCDAADRLSVSGCCASVPKTFFFYLLIESIVELQFEMMFGPLIDMNSLMDG